MPTDGDSFLPRIQSVFYAVFDVRQGPKIVYQVPEGLIAVPPTALSSYPSVPPTPSTETPPAIQHQPQPPGLASRNSSISIISPPDIRSTDIRSNSRGLIQSPHKRSSSSNRVLFNFDDISQYVIPRSPLCGRLVVCSTKRHQIMGFPVELSGKYQRNYFRYNLCFVFERGADLSCYEPIVRKVSRVLTACEEESSFLSSPDTSPALHAILEQLYEDLNSYSETSIQIDQFNSIELKIFPFYPNPPGVKDWMVPVALINLTKRIEDNWDLTIAKICPFIDGINHVSRISRLAECDITLTRVAISHLLYYQVIMTIDIFQYSNMYTLRKSMQWMADEPHVKEECGSYVVKPGASIPDWPKLLRLYSRLRPGKTVLHWMREHDVHELGIDVRRFMSFGVIKGFLRRVHRWPYLHQNDVPGVLESRPTILDLSSTTNQTRKRIKSFSNTSLHFPYPNPTSPLSPLDMQTPQNLLRGRSPQTTPSIPSTGISPDLAMMSVPSTPRQHNTVMPISPFHRPRRASAAEKVLEQVRSRDMLHNTTSVSPRTSWIHYSADPSFVPGITATTSSPQDPSTKSGPESRRQSLIADPAQPLLGGQRPHLSRSPSAPLIATAGGQNYTVTVPYPPELLALLDGEHHTDELAVRFEAGWPLLSRWLKAAGGAVADAEDSDYGKVSIIYR